jgi:hypothetical protein
MDESTVSNDVREFAAWLCMEQIMWYSSCDKTMRFAFVITVRVEGHKRISCVNQRTSRK